MVKLKVPSLYKSETLTSATGRLVDYSSTTRLGPGTSASATLHSNSAGDDTIAVSRTRNHAPTNPSLGKCSLKEFNGEGKPQQAQHMTAQHVIGAAPLNSNNSNASTTQNSIASHLAQAKKTCSQRRRVSNGLQAPDHQIRGGSCEDQG